MKVTKTARGFDVVEFEDSNRIKCSIQKSSLAEDDCIWIGVSEANPKTRIPNTVQGGSVWIDYPLPENVLLTTRMHLNRQQVEEILPILKHFVETGEINIENGQ